MEWQPIETAPKHEYVIVYPPTWNDVVSCAKWDDDRYARRPKPFWSRTDDLGKREISRGNPPTHWMPLLEPPKN